MAIFRGICSFSKHTTEKPACIRLKTAQSTHLGLATFRACGAECIKSPTGARFEARWAECLRRNLFFLNIFNTSLPADGAICAEGVKLFGLINGPNPSICEGVCINAVLVLVAVSLVFGTDRSD